MNKVLVVDSNSNERNGLVRGKLILRAQPETTLELGFCDALTSGNCKVGNED